MKVVSQLTGVFPSDAGVSRPTQELFEQFYESYGLPNEDEKLLLQRAGHVDLQMLEDWCE